MPTEPVLRLVVAYLAVLQAELADVPDGERLFAEAEAHLYEATARALAAGMTSEEAQRAAIDRFGRVRTVADAARGTTREPCMHDARDGLPAEARGDLVRASRLALLLKDANTAVVGYWIDEVFAGALLVRRRDTHGDLATPPIAPARTLHVEDSPAWRNLIVPALHAGMRIQAEVWQCVPRLWFGPIHRIQSTSLSPNQLSLSFAAHGQGRLRRLQVRLG